MGLRNHRTEALSINLLREGIVESRHFAEAVICDDRGRVLACAGSPETSTFIRSSLKPFQALTVLSTGTLERFQLRDRDLSVICASHQGSIEQVRQVFNIFWNTDISVECLRCPIPVARKSRLEYNCSGKHAGMLAVCKQQNWPLENYLQVNHPVQQQILKQIADLLKMPAAEFITAQDDCGAPTLFMQLSQMGWLYAQLSSGSNLYMERVVRAMTHHPVFVAGTHQFDTDLMEATEGSLVSKTGAEGVQCIGRVGEGMGLALKVRDGAKRAKYAAAIHILREMGWIDPQVADQLSNRYLTLNAHKRLDVTGELVCI
ncbi:MAG: asparaginase [Cyanobacteria bacterium P01_F01_bin.42]